MTAGTDTARSGHAGPATPSRRVLAQARFEATGLLRHGEQLLVSVVLPLMALVGLAMGSTPHLGSGRRVDLAAAGVAAMAVMSTAFTGQAILLAFERRYGVLRLLGTTPLGRSGLLAAKALSVLVVLAVQLLVLGVTALALGWRPDPVGIPLALLVGLLGTAAFAGLALLLGGTLRAEGVLALANLIWIVLVAGGGVLVPTEQLPGALGPIARMLPSGALGDGMRAALVEGRLDLVAALVLLVWAAGTSLLVTRVLRWSD